MIGQGGRQRLTKMYRWHALLQSWHEQSISRLTKFIHNGGSIWNGKCMQNSHENEWECEEEALICLSRSSTGFHLAFDHGHCMGHGSKGDNSMLMECPYHMLPLFSMARLLWRPLHKRDWEPVTITLQALSLVEKAEPVQVRFTLRLRDQWSTWMQDGCKVYMDSYMASIGSCFMVTWIIFKNRLLEVGLTQNQETMTLRTLTTIELLYFIMHE
jgi:hypothetical protein